MRYASFGPRVFSAPFCVCRLHTRRKPAGSLQWCGFPRLGSTVFELSEEFSSIVSSQDKDAPHNGSSGQLELWGWGFWFNAMVSDADCGWMYAKRHKERITQPQRCNNTQCGHRHRRCQWSRILRTKS